MRLLLLFLILLTAGYAILSVLLYLYQGRLVYFPDPVVRGTPADAGLEYQERWITTADGERINAWWLPAARGEAPTLLFLHGNAGNISQRLDSLRIFNSLGLNSLIIDYRGFGRSSGKPSEQGTYLDAQAAYDFLLRDLGISSQRLIIFGRSLGGGIASWLASRNDCAGIIIESSFLSVPELGQEVYPWLPVRWLARIRYDSAARMPELNCPLLVVHSRDDQLIPFRHGQGLYTLANEPKYFLEISGNHGNGFLSSGKRYQNGLKLFLMSLFNEAREDLGGPGPRPQNQ